MLYGESGMTDLDTKIKCRMVNFRAKLENGNCSKFSSLLCNLMESLSKKSDLFHFKWLHHVKSTLDEAGFSDIWEIKNADTLWLKSIFSQRTQDIFQQKAGWS